MRAVFRAALGLATTLAPLVMASQTPTGATAAVAKVQGRVTGLVYDSLAMRPLEGALVQLVLATNTEKARSITAAADGSFAFDSVAAGVYLLGFLHPRLDSLGIESQLLRVDVVTSGTLYAPLSIWSRRTMLRRLCGEKATSDSTGLFMGMVRSGIDGETVAKAKVKVQWSEVTLTSRGIDRRRPAVLGETSEAGGFAICSIPAAGSVAVRAWTATDSSGFVDFDLPVGGVMVRDIYVGAAVADSVVVTDSASGVQQQMPFLRGPVTMRGTVRGPTGVALPQARIVVWGVGAEARTASGGTFMMKSLPVGTYMIEARAIGFLPERRPIDIRAGAELVADFALESMGRYLDTVRVKGTRTYTGAGIADFERRKKAGFGYFMDADAIEKRNPIYLADILRMVPGLEVRSSMQRSGYQVTVRRPSSITGGPCYPLVVLDGARMSNTDGFLEDLVSMPEVKALEVYTRGSSMPAEFNSVDGCGAIVIWTGSRLKK